MNDQAKDYGLSQFSRISGFAAVGFACLIVIDNVLVVPAGFPLTSAETSEVIAFFTTNQTLVGIAATLAPLVWVLATLFGAGAVSALWPSERDRGEAWSLVGFAGLLLQNATFTAVFAIRLALATATAHNSTATAELWALHDALFTLNGTFLALALVGLSISGRRAGLVGQWLAWLGLLSAALQFSSASLTQFIIDDGGPLSLLGLVGWLLWVVWLSGYGITLIRRDTLS